MSYTVLFTGLSILAGMLLLSLFIGTLRTSKDNYIALSLFAALAVYCFGYALELQCFPLPITLHIIGIEYIGIAIAPSAVFILVIRYLGVQTETIKKFIPSLLIIPFSSLVVIWTPLIIPWFYEQAWMNTSSIFPGFEMIPGVWWYVISIWNVLLLTSSLIILIIKTFKNRDINWKISILICIGVLAPFLSFFLNFYLRKSIPIDSTPFFLMITGITLFPAINKHNFLHIVPVAYATVFNTLGSGLIVLDNKGKIREINKEAEKIFSVSKVAVIGEKIQSSLQLGNYLYNIIDHSSGKREEISISQSGKIEYYHIDIIPFDEGDAIKTGTILMITCISEWKEKEDKLIEYTEIIEMRNSELNGAYKELEIKQDALKESEKSLKKAHEIAGLGIYELNLSSRQIFISDELFSIIGLDSTNKKTDISDISEILKLVKPSYFDLVSSSFDSLIKSGTSFTIEFWIMKFDGKNCALRGKGEINQDNLKREKYATFIFQDITERKQMEEDIQEANLEKEILLKEIHHRVKNNMQIISSLLSMQSRTIKDPEIQMIFRETQARVRSLALVHEQLYQSTNLNKINYREYIQKITKYLLQSHEITKGTITYNLICPDIELTIEKAVPCSLILSELLTNSFKHAFREGQTGEINIRFSFSSLSNLYTLDYRDNGKGFPQNMYHKEGIGSTLINGLVRQLSGHISFENGDTGVHYSITFPGDIPDKK